MARSSTVSIVLDTSIVAKSVLKPPRHLPARVYEREVETRRKIHAVLEIIENRGYVVYFPRAGVVEVAAVLKRGGLGRDAIAELVRSLVETFVVVDENVIYGKALEVALERAPSGFDTYFIALALVTGSVLVTDDKSMAVHARALGVETILVREESLERIRGMLAGGPG